MFSHNKSNSMCHGSFRLLALIQPHGSDPVSHRANKPIEYAARLLTYPGATLPRVNVQALSSAA